MNNILKMIKNLIHILYILIYIRYFQSVGPKKFFNEEKKISK